MDKNDLMGINYEDIPEGLKKFLMQDIGKERFHKILMEYDSSIPNINEVEKYTILDILKYGNLNPVDCIKLFTEIKKDFDIADFKKNSSQRLENILLDAYDYLDKDTNRFIEKEYLDIPILREFHKNKLRDKEFEKFIKYKIEQDHNSLSISTNICYKDDLREKELFKFTIKEVSSKEEPEDYFFYSKPKKIYNNIKRKFSKEKFNKEIYIQLNGYSEPNISDFLGKITSIQDDSQKNLYKFALDNLKSVLEEAKYKEIEDLSFDF